jgi:tRNA pseudouridine38/39 synthase
MVDPSNGTEPAAPPSPVQPQRPPFDPIKDELPYIQILNRILPDDIRILAWCPHPPPDFNARFSCKERRYRYFFTQPAFAPTPRAAAVSALTASDTGQGTAEGGRAGTVRDGYLDIAKMRQAAAMMEGLHDWRNFCKIDPGKQMVNFQRRVFRAEIQELDASKEPVGFVGGAAAATAAAAGNLEKGEGVDTTQVPKVYSFNVHGSAFLWHQVRHLVAVLFLVGQGLEQPSIVADLLDVDKTPTKPHYDMAMDEPLVLWDCIFPAEGSGSREDALQWIYAGDQPPAPGTAKRGLGSLKYGFGSIVDVVWSQWRNAKMREVLAGSLIDVVVGQGRKVMGDNDTAAKKPRYGVP